MATKVYLNQLAQNGAANGQVITWNNTSGLWEAATPSGGGSSSGIAGAVQISGGSGAFSSDATNFFFDDTANQLQLNGGTGYGLLIAGQNGGVSVAPASSVTGAFTTFNGTANATGNVNMGIVNTNTSSGTSNARISASTGLGGGDPFLRLSTAEAGYIIGVDNDASDKLFIGLGTDPSTMTVTGITMDVAHIGILQTSPTAKLHVGAGTTAAGTAPFKIDSGTAMTATEDGAMEYHGSHLYFTIGSTRYQLDQQTTTSLALNAITAATNTNSINNVAYAQTWAWNSLTTGTAFINSSTSITSGTLHSIVTGNSSLNSTGGLLYVANSGTSTSGLLAQFAANGNIGGSGFTIKTNGTHGFGTASPTALVHLGGSPEVANGGVNGMALRVETSGLTDNSTTASGTVTHTAVSAFNAPTLYANNTSVTYTSASTVYIEAAPTNGTNITITNPYALFVANGRSNFSNLTATTNAIQRPMQINTALTTGTVGNNFGTGILFQGTANNSGTPLMQDMTAVNSIWTNATNGSRNSAVTIHGVQSAGSLSEMVRFTAAGAPYMIIASSMGTVGDTVYRNNGIIATSSYSVSSSGSLTLTSDGTTSFVYLTVGDNTTTSTSGVDLGNSMNQVQTSGTRNGLLMSIGFAPTSGTAVHNKMAFTGTINQTGGANGIWRGIYMNHTMTNVANGRLIELAESHANLKGIYQTGTLTTNNFVGKTAFGSTSAPTEMINVTGNIIVAGQYASTRFGLTDGGTIALNWNNGNVQSVTIAGNRTFTFTNPKEGGRYLICLKQDATGSRTITWPTITWAGGTAPTLTTTANKMDIITLVYANSTYYGEISKNY